MLPPPGEKWVSHDRTTPSTRDNHHHRTYQRLLPDQPSKEDTRTYVSL